MTLEGTRNRKGLFRQLEGEQQKKLERHYAHFHRILGGLLHEFSELPGVVWAGEPEGHELKGDGMENAYTRAVYPISDLSPYQEVLRELARVQQEGRALLPPDAPFPGLLLPTVLEGVQFARLHRSLNHASERLGHKQALSRLRTLLKRTTANLEKFKAHASTHDPRRETVEREVRQIRQALERVENGGDEAYRFRTQLLTVQPYVYLDTGDAVQVYLRTHGLILVGPNVEIAWANARRRSRSDKRTPEPLLTIGKLKVFRERDWQKAGEH